MAPERTLDGFAAHLASHPEGFAGLFGRMGYLVLLPLLELPYPEVSERLLLSLAAVGVPEQDARAVSLRALVGFAVEQGGSYWAGHALAWLDAGCPLDRDTADALDRGAADKHGWPQALRHRASRSARRWRRQNDTT